MTGRYRWHREPDHATTGTVGLYDHQARPPARVGIVVYAQIGRVLDWIARTEDGQTVYHGYQATARTRLLAHVAQDTVHA